MINNNNDKTYGSRKLSVRVPEVSRKSESSEVRGSVSEVETGGSPDNYPPFKIAATSKQGVGMG